MMLHQEPWLFTLHKLEGALYMDVLCGTVGMYEMRVRVPEAVISAWRTHGLPILQDFARRVRANPDSFDPGGGAVHSAV